MTIYMYTFVVSNYLPSQVYLPTGVCLDIFKCLIEYLSMVQVRVTRLLFSFVEKNVNDVRISTKHGCLYDMLLTRLGKKMMEVTIATWRMKKIVWFLAILMENNEARLEFYDRKKCHVFLNSFSSTVFRHTFHLFS